MSNAQNHEAEAVRTTIVGGRPPGSGRNNITVPRGIEVLVKKASVDAGFRELLLKQRGKAAATIQLELDPAENAMLSAIPQEQLAQIVDHTTVPMELRPAFMGWVAPVMLAALGVGLAASSLDAQSFSIAGAPISMPIETTTNVPPSNVENTNPPPLRPAIAGVMMPVPPPISPTNAPATNPPSTNVISPAIAGIQPPVVVFGLMMTPPANPPPTNATPAEPTPTNPPTVEIRTWMPPVHGLP